MALFFGSNHSHEKWRVVTAFTTSFLICSTRLAGMSSYAAIMEPAAVSDPVAAARGDSAEARVDESRAATSRSDMTKMEYMTSEEFQMFVDLVTRMQYMTSEQFQVFVDLVVWQKTAIRNRETSAARARTASAVVDVGLECVGPHWCATCCIWLGNQARLQDHFISKKHRINDRKVRKRAAMARALMCKLLPVYFPGLVDTIAYFLVGGPPVPAGYVCQTHASGEREENISGENFQTSHPCILLSCEFAAPCLLILSSFALVL